MCEVDILHMKEGLRVIDWKALALAIALSRWLVVVGHSFFLLSISSTAPKLTSPVLESKEIPRKFVREYGLKALLKDQICLKVRDGKEWNVGLTKSNNGTRVWLHYGWEKLVGFYSVKSGYFLVFKYENPSPSFYVVIFDHTATEIEYPVKKTRLDKAKEKVKMETYFDDDCLDLDFKDGDLSSGVKKPTNSRWRPPSTGSQQARAMAEANRFQSMTLNPSFICKIWPSHIHRTKSLSIPKNFADMNLEDSITKIILKASDGRMWSGECGFYWTPKMQRMTFYKYGWKSFIRDNNLAVGDFCVFEMTGKNSTTVAFKVESFRAS
ncbi:hypothetical protein Csa_005915 [Cucumis sativus]|nr:hypothetical protein Csa_005915 [Cucumis sativus]